MAFQVITQRTICEFKLPIRLEMFRLAGEIADRWLAEYPDDPTSTPNGAPIFGLSDSSNYRSIAFNVNTITLDFEGEVDLARFIVSVKRMAENIRDIVKPGSIERIGYRQFCLVPGVDFEAARASVGTAFINPSRWPRDDDRDGLSDVSVVLELKTKDQASKTDSSITGDRVQFGPYLPSRNLKTSFKYPDHPALSKISDGFLFDIDRGVGPMSAVSALNPKTVEATLTESHKVNQGRLRDIMHAMGFGD